MKLAAPLAVYVPLAFKPAPAFVVETAVLNDKSAAALFEISVDPAVLSDPSAVVLLETSVDTATSSFLSASIKLVAAPRYVVPVGAV